MPKYDYYCERCDDQYEMNLTMEAANVTVTCHCGQPMRKLYSPTPTIFKGDGWAGKSRGK